MSTDRFHPRHAIVTASDSGIGAATAVALADAGMDVGITWHEDHDGAERTADAVRSRGRNAVVARFDATDFDAVPGVIDDLREGLGGLDVFVNNAGASTPRPLLEVPMQEWLDTMALNIDGAFLGLQTAAGHMVRAGRGGRLIAVTSVHAHQPRVGLGAYIAAKHGLSGLIRPSPRSSAITASRRTRSPPGRSRPRRAAAPRRTPTAPIGRASRWDGPAGPRRSRR